MNTPSGYQASNEAAFASHRWLWLNAIAAVILLPLTASAHVLDEYVQATQIVLSSNGMRFEVRLTPGVEVSDRVFQLIDLNRDNQRSATEETAYIQHVLKDLKFEIDGHRVPLTLTNTQFPDQSEMKEGNSAIRLELFAEATMSAGDHQLVFVNNHLPEISVYNANALLPTDGAIEITAQQRDASQHKFQLRFRVSPPAASITSTNVATTDAPSPRPFRLIAVCALLTALGLTLLLWRRFAFRMRIPRSH